MKSYSYIIYIKSHINKKSLWIDGVPQNLFKDSMTILQPIMLDCRYGLDESLKVARVTPLHKKDDKKDIRNYRPILNLSVISIVYEKCFLSRLQEEVPNFEGENQHGFRPQHSTVTALLTIQSKNG